MAEDHRDTFTFSHRVCSIQETTFNLNLENLKGILVQRTSIKRDSVQLLAMHTVSTQ